MLLRCVSDLHLEFYQSNEVVAFDIVPVMENDSETVLILAGDIITTNTFWVHEQFFSDLNERFKKIIYVLGNHEFYRSEYFAVKDEFKKLLSHLDNFILLDDTSITINNQKFFGSTLWTDMNNGSPLCKLEAKASMPENRGLITYKTQFFSPDISVEIHKESLTKMGEFLSENKDAIIITHHAPSFNSVGENYVGSSLNGAFVSDLDEFILTHQPKLWFHGHCHDSADYAIGETRVVCNPKAYRNERQTGKPFDGSMLIEI